MSGRYVPKLFIIAGFATVIGSYAAWIAAAMLDGNWSMSNALSDLGVSNVLGARLVFNLGCMYNGLFYSVFGYGKFKRDSGWNKLSGLCCVVAGLSIMSIAVLVEDPPGTFVDPSQSTEMMHMTMTSIYGGASAIAMALSGMGDFREHREFTVITTVLLLICGAAALFGTFPVFEVISVSMIAVWIIIQCIRYIRTDHAEFRTSATQ